MSSSSFDLVALGWDENYQQHLRSVGPTLEPARVAIKHKGSYSLLTGSGELTAEASGRLSYAAASPSDLPAVGDWVALQRSGELGVIHAVLPRRSVFSRKVAGFRTEEQVVAANVDHVFICSALDSDLNLRRIERYLTLCLECRAIPVVALTKADRCDDVAGAIEQVEQIAVGTDVVAVSAVDEDGLDPLAPYLETGTTIALLGSSGVGKSTLVNRLLDSEVMVTRDLRWHGKGRHTTTHRRLIPLPGGGALIDTPGMRELQLWDADEGIEASFSDIAELASGCRFRDCSHDSEPGCAVQAALTSGELDASRLASLRKQERELAALARRKDKRLASEQSKKWTKSYREAKVRARRR